MELTLTDKRYLVAAQGWVELGDMVSAIDELECIAPENRGDSEVLCVRWEIFRMAKKWDDAVELARNITRIAPARFEGWWMLSFSLHELKRTQEAHDNLKSVRGKFANEALLHYNLACYLVHLGRVEEVRCSPFFRPAEAVFMLAFSDCFSPQN